MTVRDQKIVVIAMIAAIGAFVAYVAADNLLLVPAADLDARAQRLRKDIGALESTDKHRRDLQARMNELSGQMIKGTENQAGGYIAATVMSLLDASHLGGRLQSGQPLAPRSMGANFREIGQAIHVKGKLDNIIDFLYLLDAQPYLHRLDNIVVNRDANAAEIDLNLHYTVVIADTTKGRKSTSASSPAIDMTPDEKLDVPQRRSYDVIASRALLRPYIKRIVEVAPTPSPTGAPPTPAPHPTAQQDFNVCGLTTWGVSGKDAQDIILRNTQSNEMRHYKIGDKLPNGAEAIMIDYRPMPIDGHKSDSPEIDSPSRLIMKLGQEFWSVEIERNLSDKRLMKTDQLPMEVRGASSAPATANGKVSE